MSEAILDWKEAMARVDPTRGLYVKLLLIIKKKA